MTTRYEHFGKSDSFDDDVSTNGADREISLGTTTVLGIFVALALLCALFFGFGYSMGRRSTPPLLSNVDPHVSASSPSLTDEPASPASSGDSSSTSSSPAPVSHNLADPLPTASRPAASKPSARELAPSPATAQRAVVAMPAQTTPAQTTPAQTTPAKTTTAQTVPAPVRDQPAPAAASPTPAVTAASSAAQSYVQVAAISHREDADLLLASLRRRGYAATARPGAQDNLLHIQVGPLASRKEAEAMRQRLLADGYNAIVK